MELGPPNHNGDGLLGLNSIMAVSMDPLRTCSITWVASILLVPEVTTRGAPLVNVMLALKQHTYVLT